MFIQSLDDNGNRVGSPMKMSFSAEARHPFVVDADVSNVLLQGTKFVVYSTPHTPKRLYLEVAEAGTNKPIGKRILLARGEIGGLSIDPQGAFILFSKQAHGRTNFLYQALDGTGTQAAKRVF